MAEKKVKKKVTLNQYEAMFLLGAGFATELENAQKIVRGIIEHHAGEIIVLNDIFGFRITDILLAQPEGGGN